LIPEVLIRIDNDTSVPLYRQIYEQLRHAILTGLLQHETALPPSRVLAGQLGVSRTVVLEAYGQLQSEGYVLSRQGAGTCVNAPPKPVTAPATKACETYNGQLNGKVNGLIKQADLPLWAPSDKEQPRSIIDFRHGIPAWDQFPMGQWVQCLSEACRQAAPEHLTYANAEGALSLRTEIAALLRHTRSLHANPDHIIITTGATQALDILTRVLLQEGDPVVVEDPGHPVLRDLFAYSGAEVVPVPVDRDGLCVDQMNERTIGKTKPPKLVYVTPSHQFPAGVTLSLERRLQLLEWASAHHALIVEDDYDSEFRYEGNKQSSLAGLLPSGNAVYIGSFSKSLFPSLRIGYVVLPASLKPAFLAVKWITDRLSPVLEQEALARFIRMGKYARHIRKMSRLYAARRSCLVHALKQVFGKRATVHGAEAGLHLMVELETELEVQRIQRACLAEGIRIYPATEYFALRKPARPMFLLGYANLSEDQIRHGIRILSQVVDRAPSR